MSARDFCAALYDVDDETLDTLPVGPPRGPKRHPPSDCTAIRRCSEASVAGVRVRQLLVAESAFTKELIDDIAQPGFTCFGKLIMDTHHRFIYIYQRGEVGGGS